MLLLMKAGNSLGETVSRLSTLTCQLFNWECAAQYVYTEDGLN